MRKVNSLLLLAIFITASLVTPGLRADDDYPLGIRYIGGVADKADILEDEEEWDLGYLNDDIHQITSAEVLLVTTERIPSGFDVRNAANRLLDMVRAGNADLDMPTNNRGRQYDVVYFYVTSQKRLIAARYNEECLDLRWVKDIHETMLKPYLDKGEYKTAFENLMRETMDKIVAVRSDPDRCEYSMSPSESIPAIPPDTICATGWPGGNGKTLRFEHEIKSCDLFEVADQEILKISQEAVYCCSSGCPDVGGDFDCRSRLDGKLCEKSVEMSGLDIRDINDDALRKCATLYVIQGFGKYSKWIEGYFDAEIACKTTILANAVREERGEYQLPIPSCLNLDGGDTYGMKCFLPEDRKSFWNSDTNMSKNSCYASHLPASASLLIIKTGVCSDYSFGLTTVLRTLGYSEDEVMSATQAKGNTNIGHAYNYVKLPGDDKYTIVDTVWNNVFAYRAGQLPGSRWPYFCDTGQERNCYNDNGEVKCPPISQLYGC
jgi:hypothetical protein